MSVVVATPKAGKPARRTGATTTADSRSARFRSRAFTRELTAAFHGAKLRVLDAAKRKA